MFKRFVKPVLDKALKRSKVVLLNGARQVGKTTLAREYVENGYHYVTFDDENVYLAAKRSPDDFIKDSPKPLILDEVQRIPELFLRIKMDVDAHQDPGRYLLTGSANPLLIPKLGDSLAGRMEVIDMLPLSMGEILNKKEHFVDTIFEEVALRSPSQSMSKKELYNRMVIGGYPSVQHIDSEMRDAWLGSYINLILQKDVKDLAHIEKITEMPHLLRILAARSSQLLNVANVSTELKMVNKTVDRYLTLLQAVFMAYLQPSWSNNLTTRLVKSPKVYLVDSGLLSYLLNVTVDRMVDDNFYTGNIVENFIVGELKKQALWSSTQVELFHFRTSSGEEVDIVLEDRSGNIVGIEIKSSSTVAPHDFKGLIYLQNKTNHKFKRGIVLYTGNQYIPFGHNLCALPINALWEDIVLS
jgi:predicted AAA+ superfamily ATPase